MRVCVCVCGLCVPDAFTQNRGQGVICIIGTPLPMQQNPYTHKQTGHPNKKPSYKFQYRIINNNNNNDKMYCSLHLIFQLDNFYKANIGC